MATKPIDKARALKLLSTIEFDSDDESSAFRNWLLTKPALLAELGALSRDDLIRECVRTCFEFSELLHRHGLQQARRNRFISKVYEALPTIEAKVASHQKNKAILDAGRTKAPAKRKEIAAEKQEKLLTAIYHLFDSPDKPGWIWSAERITNKLDGANLGYKRSTILRVVKREKAKYHAARNKA